jgi:hypothetical protein
MITNWYEKLPKDKDTKIGIKRDKTFKNHMVEPCSMVVCIGPTGSGKTNSLIEFLHKKQNAFCDIILFTGSTSDEPLYRMLQEKIPEMKTYTDINEFPELNSFEDDKENEKLVIFDDFINLSTKEMKKINRYLTAGRKFGITCFCLAQNYTDIGKQIMRNAHYILIYQMNDNTTINNVLKNHNIHNIDKQLFKNLYQESTKDKLNFFMIDLKNKDSHLRHNYNKILLKI